MSNVAGLGFSGVVEGNAVFWTWGMLFSKYFGGMPFPQTIWGQGGTVIQ